MVQFFACFPCGFNDLRFRDGVDPTAAVNVPIPEHRAYVRPCDVTTEEAFSLPDWQSIDQFAPAATDISLAIAPDEPWEAYREAAEKLGVSFDLRTQVGGYPTWLQGGRQPKGLDFLMQIDSEVEAELVWGTGGVVYLFNDPSFGQITLLHDGA